MKVGRFLVVAMVLGLSAPAAGQGTGQGTSQNAGDSDIVRLAGAEWRLHGIDFPDPRQVCSDGWRAGEVSRAAVQRLTDGAKLDCRNTAKDQYSRAVASCTIDGEDLGATLVRQGMAWAALRQTWRYVLDDWMAWFAGNGLYGHPCEKPAEWRARTSGSR